jgi:COP9 signalosome complex subunit 4
MNAEHQNASTSSGMTVLQNSIIEHNILAVSKLYENIRFDQLAKILGINAIQAEHLASSMIESSRLNASIDQPAQIVIFQHTAANENTNDSSASKLKQAGNRVLSNWDAQIGSICSAVDSAAQRILLHHPHYAAQLTQQQQNT